MQIHELNNFTGTPTSSDYLAIDNSTTTTKIGATGLGVQDKLTVAEANTGTSTASRIVTPKVVHDYVTGEVSDGIDNILTSATETKWAGITGGDGSINDIADYLSKVVGCYGSLYNTASNTSLTTTATKILLKDFSGSGCSLSSNGIKVENAGVYQVSIQVYLGSGFTADDYIHISVYVNSTDTYHYQYRVHNATMWTIISFGTKQLTLSANDVVYMYAYNQNGARGLLSNNTIGISLNRIA